MDKTAGRTSRFLVALALCWVAHLAPAAAAVPHLLNYQGYLTNASGQPVTGTVAMVLRLYDAPAAATALYSETQATVGVNNGIYVVAIGSVTALTLPFDVPYWLGVKVGADPEMTPRQPLTASPYALRAAIADGVAAAQITGVIGTTQIADGAVTPAKLSANYAGSAGAGGAATTALALAANGTNCLVAGQFATGVDAQGNAEGCAAPPGGTVTSVTASAPLASSGGTAPNISLTGSIPVASGGTGQATLPSNGILYGQGTGAVGTTGAGAAGQVLVGTASAPVWTDSPAFGGKISTGTNAGDAAIVQLGERYRDNGIAAWAVVRADGFVYSSFGVASVAHTTGTYAFTTNFNFGDNTKMVVVAAPEIDSPPTTAAAARLVSVNTISGNTFTVYITNGSYVLVDNDFMVIATGR